MIETDLFPFGKYKGSPLSVVLNDANYCEWLLSQAWVSEKHPELLDFLCNGESAGNETPRHNALQSMFLNASFQLAFLQQALEASPRYQPYIEHLRGVTPAQVEFECDGFDVLVRGERVRWEDCGDLYRETPLFLVEVKPSLSDDYPAVLRQIKTAMKVRESRWRGYDRGTPVLLLGSFSSKAVTTDQLREIFAKSSVAVIFSSDLEKAIAESDTKIEVH